MSPHVADAAGEPRLRALHGQPLRPPQPGYAPPAEEHLAWHRREVYRGV